jgi:hypothetical protein
VRSLILCNTNLGNPLEGLLVLAYETPRTWTSAEKELVRIVSQQIGLILHQWNLQRQVIRQQQIFRHLQAGLSTLAVSQPLHPEFDPYACEQAILESIANLLNCPLVTLLAWSAGDDIGRIAQTYYTNHQFALNASVVVSVYTDELIQEALSTEEMILVSADDLLETTAQWLRAPGLGEILAIALRTAPEHEATAILVAAKERGRAWPESALPAFGLLVTQLAWMRRYSMLTATLSIQRQDLEQLNWYKHRCLEDFQRCVETGVKGISQLDSLKDADFLKNRIRQISQQVGNSLNTMSQLLDSEQWHIRPLRTLGDRPPEKISPTSLLKRSLDRVEQLLTGRRLWSQVHEAKSEQALPAQLTFTGELCKIELIIYEVLVAACYRAPEGGRIDIWYRLLPSKTAGTQGYTTFANAQSLPILELSITDNGTIDPQLIAELRQHPQDLLAPSTLERPPGLHLSICQSLVQQIGGQLKLYQIEDGRVLSRLLIPLQSS